MAINLLPSEQKLKFKKQKSVSATHNIEMTGPKKVEKSKSSIKSGGVLGFFKQAFRTPKAEEKNKEEKKDTSSVKAPEKKILFKEKISYKTVRRVPKIEYQMPVRKPESFGEKSSVPISNKISNIFDTPKIQKNKSTESKTKNITFDSKEKFPKYSSVSTEQLFSKKNLKTKKVKVIEVVSDNGDNVGKKKSGKSVWTKIQEWFSKIFGSKKSSIPAPDPAKISGLSGFPQPKDGKLEITYEKEVTKDGNKEDPGIKKQIVDSKIGSPKDAQPKKSVLSYNAPMVNEEVVPLAKDESKKINTSKEVIPKISYVNTPLPSSPKPVNKIKKEVDKPAAPQKIKEDKKSNNYFGWFSKFWKSLLALFISDNKNRKDVKPARMTTVEDEIKVSYEKNKSTLDKIDFNKPEDNIEVNKEIVPTPPLPPAPMDIPKPPINQGTPTVDVQEKIDEKKLTENLTTDSINIPVPAPPTKLGSDVKKDVVGSKNIIQTEGAKEDIIGMDWEVNLIPEDSQEKNIPVSIILFLIMSVVISGALVFGGWLWASYYHNTISTTISEIDAEISLIEADISQYSQLQEDARIIQNKITSVQDLLDKHIYWSEFFNKLEFYTITDVYYSSMSVDINGAVTLSAVGSSYENAVKQLMVMEKANDYITKVTISDITFQNDTAVADENTENENQIISEELNVNFNINLMVQPEIFYYPKISL